MGLCVDLKLYEFTFNISICLFRWHLELLLTYFCDLFILKTNNYSQQVLHSTDTVRLKQFIEETKTKSLVSKG